MRRTIVMALAAVAFAAAAATANAAPPTYAYSTGFWGGTPGGPESISFRVIRGEIYSLRLAIYLDCEDVGPPPERYTEVWVLSARKEDPYYELFLPRNGRTTVSFAVEQADRNATVRLRFRLGKNRGFVNITVFSETDLESCMAFDRFDVRHGPG